MSTDGISIEWGKFFTAAATGIVVIAGGVVSEHLLASAGMAEQAGGAALALVCVAVMVIYLGRQAKRDEFERRIDLISTKNAAIATIGFVIIQHLLAATVMPDLAPFAIYALPGQFILFKEIMKLLIQRAFAKEDGSTTTESFRH